MIKYTTYQFTKDRKIGIEIKAWERGHISGVIECRQDNGMMIRQLLLSLKRLVIL